MKKSTILLAMLLCCFVGKAKDPNKIIQTFNELDSKIRDSAENNPVKTLEFCRQQELLAYTSSNDSLKMHAAYNKGKVLGILGIYDLSQEEYYKSLKIAERIRHHAMESEILTDIATNFQSLSDYKQSSIYFKKAKKKDYEINEFADTTQINYEIAFNAIALGDTAWGMEWMRHNLSIAKQVKDTQSIIFGLDNLSNVSAEMEENQKALAYELELFLYRDNWQNNLFRTGIYEHLSEIYFKLKQYDLSQIYLDSTFKYATLLNSNDWLIECYKVRSMLAEVRGDYKNALKDHQVYLQLKDSVYKENYAIKMSAMSSLYELENKQTRITLLEKDNQLKRTQLNSAFVGAFFLLGIVISALWYRNQRQHRRLQRTFSKQLIQSQETERQRIARELHDSIGQNILFIKNQLVRKNQNSEFTPILETVGQTIEEVRNISKDLYPNQLEKYGLAASVETLAQNVMESSEVFVSADLNTVEKNLSKDALINLYRIIQESVNNALKHAQATSIRITATAIHDKIELTVQDNGKGFDKRILARKAQRHFGLLNMEERIKLLLGKFEVESVIGKGTKLIFTLPAF